MNDKLLQRYAGRLPLTDTNGDPSPGEPEAEDLGCFGYLRGIRDRALSLEFRKANGNIVAIPYHSIERFEFDPSEGILICAHGEKIRIKGHNLNAEVRPLVCLFEGITRYKISWIREMEHHEGLTAGDNDTVISTIEW